MTKQATATKEKSPGFNRNITLYFVMLFMANLGFGIVSADFNLYILSMGLSPDILGVILSLTPFAQVLAAIPIGFLAEKIGYKRGMILVNLVVGAAYLLRVISPSQTLILLGSFLLGTVNSGYFIMQMPFISHYAGTGKDREFTLTSIVFYSATAIGNLIGGYLPGMVAPFFANEVLAFRMILVSASMLIMAGTLPLLFLDKDKPEDTSKISLSPYLRGIDKTTVKFAGIEFFIGVGMGFLMYFINVVYVYYYGSTLEAFGTMSALLIIPLVIFLFVGPKVAEKFGGLRVVIATRIIAAVLAVLVIATTSQWVGGPSYMLFRSLLGLGQTLWISFASAIATKRSRTATSTWLEITFQVGFVVAALGGGRLISLEAYPVLGIISGVAMAVAFVLTVVFFGKQYLKPVKE